MGSRVIQSYGGLVWALQIACWLRGTSRLKGLALFRIPNRCTASTHPWGRSRKQFPWVESSKVEDLQAIPLQGFGGLGLRASKGSARGPMQPALWLLSDLILSEVLQYSQEEELLFNHLRTLTLASQPTSS